MPEYSDESQQRLSEYSTRTNVNAMNIALIDQRTAILEKRVDEYHGRLHTAEDELLVVKTVQQIHDTQIQAMRKILVGNGDRETIPMDLERMDRAIAEILKVDHKELASRLGTLENYVAGQNKTRDQIINTAITVITSALVTWIISGLVG
jgi:hypothetical protein